MRNIYQKDDYTGFVYNGIHSSQFGLFSVANGDRYSRGLSPTFQDLTQSVPGQDGTHYFGTQMTQRVITLQVAFDSVTESEFHQLKRWLNCGIKPLILDETPYIQYYAKIQTAPTIQFVPFEEDVDERIYKGESTITFVCYDPYGYSVSKWLSSYGVYGETGLQPVSLYSENVREWALASRLQPRQSTKQYTIDTYQENNELSESAYNGLITLYNAGDLPVDYVLNFTLSDAVTTSQEIKITLTHNDVTIVENAIDFSVASNLLKKAMKNVDTNAAMVGINFSLDTKKRLLFASRIYTVTINGEVEQKVSDKVIANHALRGDFSKIPISENKDDMSYMQLSCDKPISKVSIDYLYKYY